MKGPTLSTALILVLLALQLGSAGCGANAYRKHRSSDRVEVRDPALRMSGQFVVKLRSRAATRFNEWRRLGGSLITKELPIDELMAVSVKHGIEEWKPLVPKPPENDPVGMGRMYILTGPPTSVSEFVKDFEAFPDLVEYVEAGGE